MLLTFLFSNFTWHNSFQTNITTMRIYTKPLYFSILSLFILLYVPTIFHSNLNKPNACDPTIIPSSNPSLKYKDRGNRCEGFYRSKVSQNNFRFVRFTKGNFQFKGKEEEVITLKIPIENTSAQVRAEGIPGDLYYRMDGTISSSTPLDWRLRDVILRDGRTKYARNIGLYAFEGENNPDTYIPVIANSNLAERNMANQPYVIQIVASTRIEEVKWKLRGDESFKLINDGESFYAGKMIPIRLPKDLASGDYTLEIEAKIYNLPQTTKKRYDIRL